MTASMKKKKNTTSWNILFANNSVASIFNMSCFLCFLLFLFPVYA